MRFEPVDLGRISCLRLQNRTEIKFAFPIGRLRGILNQLPGSYKILEINARRSLPYSTIYYDTEGFNFYYEHLRGKLNRYKVRYRIYETTGESFLEVKKKTNKGRTIKWRIENRPSEDRFDRYASDFIDHYLPFESSGIRPALVNGFARITLAGFELKERITLDTGIIFSLPGTTDHIALPHVAVAELKQETCSNQSPFGYILKREGFYPSGFSKYCIGTALLNKSLKNNMLKSKLRLLNHFEDEYSATKPA